LLTFGLFLYLLYIRDRDIERAFDQWRFNDFDKQASHPFGGNLINPLFNLIWNQNRENR